jgi:hypothetical protein
VIVKSECPVEDAPALLSDCHEKQYLAQKMYRKLLARARGKYPSSSVTSRRRASSEVKASSITHLEADVYLVRELML